VTNDKLRQGQGEDEAETVGLTHAQTVVRCSRLSAGLAFTFYSYNPLDEQGF
jgi:hypothetical protein